jgi:hypothetical protein
MTPEYPITKALIRYRLISIVCMFQMPIEIGREFIINNKNQQIARKQYNNTYY